MLCLSLESGGGIPCRPNTAAKLLVITCYILFYCSSEFSDLCNNLISVTASALSETSTVDIKERVFKVFKARSNVVDCVD